MKRFALVPFAALLLVGCQGIPAQPESSVVLSVVLDLTATDLGTLGGTYSVARGINDRAQVLGRSTLANEQFRAFLWEDGTMTDLGTLGGTISVARGINDHGQVVGNSRLANEQARAFLWEDGAMTDLGTLGGTFSVALGINDHGQVAGRSTLELRKVFQFDIAEDGSLSNRREFADQGSDMTIRSTPRSAAWLRASHGERSDPKVDPVWVFGYASGPGQWSPQHPL